MADFKFNFGDFVKIKDNNEFLEGVILESPDSEFYLLKLNSGYNIGVRKENIVSIEVVNRRVVEKVVDVKKSVDSGLPKVDIIMTGGTISSRLDYRTGGVTSLTSPEDFFRFYPEIFKIASVNRVVVPFMKLSENMEIKDWKIIGEEVEKSMNNPEVDGVIVTHGTDILHYTSSALSFFFPKPNKPVVLTFSQKSTDRASSDASLNLQCAARLAVSNIAEVVIVGHSSTNDDFCYALLGTKVRKMHSTSRDAFKPVNIDPLVKVYSDRIEKLNYFRERPSKSDKSEKLKGDIFISEKVGLIKFYPGQSFEILDYYSKICEALIIEGVGVGNVPVEGNNSWIPSIKKAINNGMMIFMTSQTVFGRTEPYVYSTARDLQKAGVIFLEDMLSEAAFVKLSWVLGNKNWNKDKETIKKKMLENVSGEINNRLQLRGD
ncbi:MAG: Glu-tRNA(Gln) amidotransferase subunit GatD [Nanoarchaeota archaeon]